MTPQVQQVFAAPIVGAIASSAALADGGVDSGRGVAIAAVGPDCGFGKLMQTDAAAPATKAIAPQTAALMPDIGAKAAVVMILQSGVNDPTETAVVVPEDPVDMPEDAGDSPRVADPAANLARPAPVPAPASMPASMIAANVTLPMILPPLQPTVPQRIDASGQAQTPAPNQPLPGGPLLSKGEKAAPGAIKAAAVPAKAGVTQNADFSVAQAPIPTATAGPPQSTLPTPAAIVGAKAVNPLVVATPAVATPSHPGTSPAMAVDGPADGPVPQPADILSAPPPATAPKPARATTAETAFRLRAGVAALLVPAHADAISAPVPERNLPLASAAPGEIPLPTVQPDLAANPAADASPPPEKSALPLIGLLADPPAPLGMHGPDPARSTPAAPAQIAPPPAANPAVAIALPPRLTTDLVTLVKTQPNGPIQILLNPAELGNLRFEIQQSADQLRVVLSVERPETMDMLRRNADQLLGEFRAAGFSGASLSFGQWDQQNSQQRASPTLPPPQPPPQDSAFVPAHLPAIPTHPSPEMAAVSGLNLRL